MTHFTMNAISPGDKTIEIWGPGDLDISIDFDDVDHATVEEQAVKLVKLLNDHWVTE